MKKKKWLEEGASLENRWRLKPKFDSVFNSKKKNSNVSFFSKTRHDRRKSGNKSWERENRGGTHRGEAKEWIERENRACVEIIVCEGVCYMMEHFFLLGLNPMRNLIWCWLNDPGTWILMCFIASRLGIPSSIRAMATITGALPSPATQWTAIAGSPPLPLPSSLTVVSNSAGWLKTWCTRLCHASCISCDGIFPSLKYMSWTVIPAASRISLEYVGWQTRTTCLMLFFWALRRIDQHWNHWEPSWWKISI